jgi:transcriptional regulator of acetoin/glycerol metabolism
VVLSGKQTLGARDLPDRFFAARSATSIPTEKFAEKPESELNLSQISKQMILKALENCRGNRTEAARQLGISRRTLHRKLNEFGLRE